MLENDTRNQHFLTRVEQKLNALNPQAADRNLRIYSFRLVDRESYSLILETPERKANRQQSVAVRPVQLRRAGRQPAAQISNRCSRKYETNSRTHTKNLLAKLNVRNGDIKADVIDLFAAKMLNFFRIRSPSSRCSTPSPTLYV